MSEIAAAPAAPSTPAPSTGSTPASAPSNTSNSSSPAPSGGPISNGQRTTADQIPDKAPAGSNLQNEVARREIQKLKLKLKVDGRDQDVELDENEIALRLQKGEAADRRFQEAAKIRKQWEDIQRLIETDPAKAIELATGGKVDLRKWAENDLIQRYEESQMTPEQQAAAAQRRELEGLKRAEQERKEFATRAKQEAFEREVLAKTERDFVSAFKELGFEPNVAKTLLPIMAELAEANLEHGIDLTPSQLAHLTRERVTAQTKAVMGPLKGVALLDYLGDGVVKEVVRAQLEKFKLGSAAAPKPPLASEAVPKPVKKPMTQAQWHKRMVLGLDDED